MHTDRDDIAFAPRKAMRRTDTITVFTEGRARVEVLGVDRSDERRLRVLGEVMTIGDARDLWAALGEAVEEVTG